MNRTFIGKQSKSTFRNCQLSLKNLISRCKLTRNTHHHPSHQPNLYFKINKKPFKKKTITPQTRLLAQNETVIAASPDNHADGYIHRSI